MAKLKITLNDLFELESAVIYNPDNYHPSSNVSIDSRKVKKGSIFFAIVGDKYDGHDFVKESVNRGAAAVIIDQKNLNKFDELDCVIVTVPDTTKAYGQLALMWRKKLNAKVISITGSNGKTTTKDILAQILSEKFNVVKTSANNNNHIGVPLTIFSADEKCEVLILEHGTNHFGEIKYTADIARPDFAMITNIGDSHLEFLVDRKGVYKEKSALLNAAENNGKVFINLDDRILRSKKEKYVNSSTFGFNSEADITGEMKGFDEFGRPLLKVRSKRKSIESVLPLLGEANAKNFLAAVAVAISLGLTKKEIIDGIIKVVPPKQRLNSIKLNDCLIIDDTYNSNPDSMKLSIDVISQINIYDRKILLLGDMFELGTNSDQMHIDLSKQIKRKKITEVYLIGTKMKHLKDAMDNSNVQTNYFKNRSALINKLRKLDFRNSVILIKGSRGMKMEEFRDIIIERAS